MNRQLVILLTAALAAACLAGCGSPPGAPAGQTAAHGVMSRPPEHPDPAARWLIYLHGAIAEGSDRRPVHPRFGPYELDAILTALAERGFEVIGEQRPAGTEPSAWAQHVADTVRGLLAAGVPPSHVTIVGFSKGGVIALLTADRLARDDLNVVAMAACGSWLEGVPELVPAGRLLSIRELSDEHVGSCRLLFDRMGPAAEVREVALDLGGGHGAFFVPRDEWLDPIAQWAGAAPAVTQPDGS